MTKYKINTDRKPLSEQDIKSNMDFNQFYSNVPSTSANWLGSTGKIILNSCIAIAVIGTASYFLMNNKGSNTKHENSEVFISPPIASMDIQKDKFIVNNDRDTTINYRSGTSIFIPANIFKTKDGKNVKGSIEIQYREFHDQVDQIFSGIPMKYDSANVISQFESAGMFDIMAYQDGVALDLKDNKDLTVNMISYNDANDFNVYYLDTVQKRWIYNVRNTEQNKEALANLNKNFIQDKAIFNPPAFIAPRKADPALDNFTIAYDKEEFPELAVYDGVKFEIEKTEKNYDPKLANTTWEDISIRRYTDNAHYVVTVKAGKRSNSFIASPVFDSKDFDAAFKAYEIQRSQREKRMAKQADSLNKLDSRFTAQAALANNNTNERFANSVQNGWTYRAIVVGRTGFWNHDSRGVLLAEFYNPKSEKKEGFNVAHFITLDGQSLPVAKAFLFSRNKNSIYPIAGKDDLQFPTKFSKNTDVMVAITNDSRIFYIQDDEFKNTTVTNNDIYFKMREIKNLKLNEEDLKQNDFGKIRSILKI